MRITRTKLERLQACANERGIIAALDLDQHDALRKEFAKQQVLLWRVLAPDKDG